MFFSLYFIAILGFCLGFAHLRLGFYYCVEICINDTLFAPRMFPSHLILLLQPSVYFDGLGGGAPG